MRFRTENIIEFISSRGSSPVWGLLAMLISNAPIIFATLLLLVPPGRWAASGTDILFVLGCIAASILIRGSIGDNNTARSLRS